jgi:hypothetical protein
LDELSLKLGIHASFNIFVFYLNQKHSNAGQSPTHTLPSSNLWIDDYSFAEKIQDGT